ncbi:glutathione peroxidase [Roseibium sp.]|uniref:glutathione peroxidase n=1 Tax=Roseibium sp. TaxID=1936156 RepID=UPI003A96EE34
MRQTLARLSFLFSCLLESGSAIADPSGATGTKATTSAHSFTFETPYGDPLPLAEFKGRPILIVNTATECGFKNQLADLQKLHEQFEALGLVILGVPSNDFGGQEPVSNKDMQGFCEARFGTQFPLTAKTSVKGANAHPFYAWATETLGPAARPYWNFHKYLVGPDGNIADWFSTPTRPTAPKVINAVERQLARADFGHSEKGAQNDQ